jgi:hypothetical protein
MLQSGVKRRQLVERAKGFARSCTKSTKPDELRESERSGRSAGSIASLKPPKPARPKVTRLRNRAHEGFDRSCTKSSRFGLDAVQVRQNP